MHFNFAVFFYLDRETAKFSSNKVEMKNDCFVCFELLSAINTKVF